jgi:hypothetical protein
MWGLDRFFPGGPEFNRREGASEEGAPAARGDGLFGVGVEFVEGLFQGFQLLAGLG